jgi:CheY-like chemotaxis protein
MPSILICAAESLRDDLRATVLWRNGHTHHLAQSAGQGLQLAFSVHPDLVLIDRDLPGALGLVEGLRREAATRAASIAIAARGDLSDLELQLLQCGANAVIRMPAGPDVDERLSGLMRVPGRRASRAPVRLELSGVGSGAPAHWGTALNISETGMLAEVEGPVPIGTRVTLHIELPGSNAPVACAAQVVREDAPGRYGVRFERLERDGLLRIRGFVASGSTTDRRLAAERSSRGES